MIRFEPDPDDPDFRVAVCERCGSTIYRYARDGSDLDCDGQNQNGCPAIYNASGQRLRDDLHSRPNRSEYDDEIGDMEGYEEAMLRSEMDG